MYDPYGNRWVSGFTEMIPAGNTPQNQNQFTSNNRIIGNAYDAAGNRLIANGKMANYGAENRLVVQVTGAFAYTERPKAWRMQSRDCDCCRGEPDVADSASLPWTGLRPVGFA